MSLTSQLPNLTVSQLKHLSDTMLNVSIAFETGGDWRAIIRRAKYGKLGLLRRIYDLLQTAKRNEIDVMSASLATLMGCK